MKRVSKHLLAVAMLLFLGATFCGASLTTYQRWLANRGRVMVMDETGTGVVELYTCNKGVGVMDPFISPPDPDGTAWIAFRTINGLYKISEHATDLTKILCGQGADFNGEPYWLAASGQWSPDGTEILVQTLTGLALIPAGFVAVLDCASPLEPIYAYDWWSGEPEGWNLEGNAAWNDDGSKIAFFENQSPASPYNRLVILGRLGDGNWEVQSIIYPDPPLPNALLYHIDWQRGGTLLAFSAFEDTGYKLMWVDMATGESGYFLNNGSPLEKVSPSWSPDGTHLIFENAQEKLVKWTYVESTFPDGPIEILGSGKQPDWQRDVVVSSCETDVDCDDGNLCTLDSCVAGSCDHESLNGGDCGDGGWCVDGSCFEPECGVAADCDDFNECTTEQCIGWACVVTNVAAGIPCTDDGDLCTVDACNGAGVCESVFDPEISGCEPVCLPKGDPCDTGADCCSGRCHPVKGCK